MEKNIAVKEMPAMKLIYCRHVGRFDQIGGAYEKVRQSACITVDEEAKPEGEFGKMPGCFRNNPEDLLKK